MKQLTRQKTLWLYGLFSLLLLLVFNQSFRPAPKAFHTADELRALQDGARSPIDSGEYFLGSVRCQGCHGFDSAGMANVDENGNDVNLYDDWQGSMMAFSAIDPMWRAKVSHEILVAPAHAAETQTKCTQCHAPMGHYSAMFKGATHYTLADLQTDTLGLNGVACGGCHQIGPDSLFGLQFSGNIAYDTSRVLYGPFTNPATGPMQLYVGQLPTYSQHVSTSAICAACHTLQTKSIDLNGQYTGRYFTEQATYHEWLNSSYNNTQPCQHCHMPQITDPVVLANGYQNLAPRSPFNLHKFMGGNATMLQLIKQNKLSLGVQVPDRHIDSSIAATLHLLQTATAQTQLRIDSLTTDTLFVSVQVTNRAGHKFPSGYPARRAFLQVAVTQGNDTVFQSGMLQPDGEVSGHDAQWEPHHRIITQPNQVQIYEMVMGDVNANRTTVLARADTLLKDNRIPPLGFTTQHSTYDTARIDALTLIDPNFNRLNGTQGTGADVVHYHIPVSGLTGNFTVQCGLYYQSIPPRWFNEMFAHSSAAIDTFKNMYQAADKAPILIDKARVDSVLLPTGLQPAPNIPAVQVYPVPSYNGIVTVQCPTPIQTVEVYDANGRLLSRTTYGPNKNVVQVPLPNIQGVYWLKTGSGNRYSYKKVLRQ